MYLILKNILYFIRYELKYLYVETSKKNCENLLGISKYDEINIPIH